jgi:Holliday junction resolvasome RuvABC endonuclease subunit
MALFLGIDQSFSSTGTVILDEESNIIDVSIISSPKTVDFFERAWIISQELNNLIYKYKPSHIALEGLAFGGMGNATRQLSGLQYTIINSFRKDPNILIDCLIIPPTTVKKFATTKGSSKKEELYNCLPDYAKDRFTEMGLKKTKGLYDCVDAFWISKYLQEQNK